MGLRVRLTCRKCGRVMGVCVNKVECLDGYLCRKCYKSMGFTDRDLVMAARTSVHDMNRLSYARKEKESERNAESAIWESFDSTYAISHFAKFNDRKKEMLLRVGVGSGKRYEVIAYDQLNDYYIHTEESSPSGNNVVKKAAIGGALFGETGAIVGAAAGMSQPSCGCVQVKFRLNGEKKYHIIDILNYKTTNPSSYMRDARSIVNKFDWIMDVRRGAELQCQSALNGSAERNLTDVSDEIRKFKSLLDDGIITQEEFDKKKKQLLDL